jgi:hypothetical protein
MLLGGGGGTNNIFPREANSVFIQSNVLRLKGKPRYIRLNIRNGGGLSQKMTQCLFMGIEGSLTMFIQREKVETSPCSPTVKRESTKYLHI